MGMSVLSPLHIQKINGSLQTGDIAAALAPLAAAVDVRWNELPKLDKPTLAAVARHLREDREGAREKATALAAAAFHNNISVRRFIRKLVQSLKGDAAPLAGPLSEQLDDYLRRTVSLPYSMERREAERRREQADVLEGSLELLWRCDTDQFMEWLGALCDYWAPLIQERERQMEALRQQASAYNEVYQKRLREIFEERYSHLGDSAQEIMAVPRLSQQLIEEVHQDPEVLAAPHTNYAEQFGQLQPLREEINTARSAVNKLLYESLGHQAKPSEPQERARAHLWRWLEAGARDERPGGIDMNARLYAAGLYNLLGMWLGAATVRERAVPLMQEMAQQGRAGTTAWTALLYALPYANPANRIVGGRDEPVTGALPAEFNPTALRALKRGHEREDQLLEQVAASLEKWLEDQQAAMTAQLAAAAAVPAAPTPAASDGPAEPGAGGATTIDERVTALFTPPAPPQVKAPMALLHLGGGWNTQCWRQQLVARWRTEPDWERQWPLIAERALPRLWQQLEQQREAFLTARKRNAPAAVSEPVAAVLTDKERKDLRQLHRQQLRFGVRQEFNDIANTIAGLGGPDVQVRVLEMTAGKGLEDPHDDLLRWLLTYAVRYQQVPLEALLPYVRAAYARTKPARRATSPRQQMSEWQHRWFEYALVNTLYDIGNPGTVAEARTLLQELETPNSMFQMMLARVRERHDFDMLLPLLRHISHPEPQLLQFWGELVQSQPQRVSQVVAGLLRLAGEAPDANGARAPLALLEKVEDQIAWFEPRAADVVRCLESPLPAVTRFSLRMLEKLPDAAVDWTALCERAGEKLWSENAGLAKDAAKFLGQAGARHAAAAEVAFAALGDALALNSLPLLESILRALANIGTAQGLQLDQKARARVQRLRAEQPQRLGKLCQRLLDASDQADTE